MSPRAFFLLLVSPLSAMFIGNPAEPGLMKKGLWFESSWGSFRAGYIDDWVYQQRFQDEFTLEGITYPQTYLKFSTYAALLTLNIKNGFDLYGIVGSSRLQIDDEIFTKRALSWGVGGKFILFRKKNFYVGVDAKYFQTDQKPRYFIVEGAPYTIESNYRLKYREVQAALGISYRAWVFAPYVNGTYIFTRIEPEPAIALVRLPDANELVDVESKSIIGKERWGMALGLSLVDNSKATLAFEWRFLNQNAININGEIRF